MTKRLLAVLATIASMVFTSTSVAEIYVTPPPPLIPGQHATCTDMEAHKRVPCPDSTMFYFDGTRLVEEAFDVKSFADLDRLYDTWCTGAERFPDGRWKLFTYPEALDARFSGLNSWKKHLDDIMSWQKLRPSSEAAVFAEAIYWNAYAWNGRGGGYARSVSKEAWELFRERLHKARAALERPTLRESACPAPHALMISVLTGAGASEAELRAVFSATVSRTPQYHQSYFAMARHYEPKWGGSAQQYERFALEAAQLTKSFEGKGMYARMYWIVDQSDDMPFDRNSGQPPAWKDLREGYEDLMKRYPSSIQNLGKYLSVACRSSDGGLYRSLRSKIKGFEDSAQMMDSIDACDRRHNWTDQQRKP
jgi:Domain of unknown function (DUF4034)